MPVLGIRKASLLDLPYIYEICLKTAFEGKDATDLFSDKWLVGQYFAAPYLHFDIGMCWVAVENDYPVGYIIGVSNTCEYEDWLNKTWLPKLQKLYPHRKSSVSEFESFVLDKIHEFHEPNTELMKYPAHMHIDLLPDYQGHGLGRKLFEAFSQELKNRSISSLHLGVASGNTQAIGFYKKLGFQKLKDLGGALLLSFEF